MDDELQQQQQQNTQNDDDFDAIVAELWGDDYVNPNQNVQQEQIPETSTQIPENQGIQWTPEQIAVIRQLMQQQQMQQQQMQQQAVDDFVKNQYAGQMNPYTGQPINTAADLQLWQQEYQNQNLQAKLQQAGISQEDFDLLLQKSPQMQQAMQLQQQAQQIIQQYQSRDAETFAQKEIQKLRTMYPQCSVQSLADLASTPEGKTALEYWKRGVPLAQAYSAAFASSIAQNGAQAAKQQAMNDMNSKGHIAQPSGGSGGGRMMSAEDRAIWKEFFPDATDAQLQEKWSKVK